MMMGDRVVIIDLGIYRKYKSDDGFHIPDKGTAAQIKGTALFASINALERKEISRRDDLESLGYSLLCLNNNNLLPWYNGLEDMDFYTRFNQISRQTLIYINTAKIDYINEKSTNPEWYEG